MKCFLIKNVGDSRQTDHNLFEVFSGNTGQSRDAAKRFKFSVRWDDKTLSKQLMDLDPALLDHSENEKSLSDECT